MVTIRWLIAILILPGTVLIVFPWVILWFSKGFLTFAKPTDFIFWLALILAGIGVTMGLWAMGLFFCFGGGTPAPWDPPKNFVVQGPYRYVRNPMISAVLTILLAESLFFLSIHLFFWFCIFLTINLVYIPTVEEKQLAKRFGRDYLAYKKKVPRWIPNVRPSKSEGAD